MAKNGKLTMATIVANESAPVGPQDERASPARAVRVLQSWAWGVGLVLLTGAIYANSLGAPYLFDDKYFFERDVTYRSVERALASPAPRRLGVLTFALDYQWHGRAPLGSHLVNVVVHATAGLLLFGLVRRTLGLPGIAERLAARANLLAGIVAANWLVHPLQTSAVTYVIQRFESLMGLCFLLALYGLLRGATARRAWPWYLLALVADWLGVQTKEVMAVLPIVALGYDRIFLSESWTELWRRRGWLHLGLVACSAWLVYEVRWAFDPSVTGSAGMGTPGVTPWEYLRSQAGVILHYLRLSVWPDYLCLDYRWPIARTPAAIYPPGAVILLLLALAGWALWTRPRLGFLGLAFFVILAPTSSVMPITDLAFEHRMYLPLAAVVTLIVAAAVSLFDRLAPSRPGVQSIAVGLAVMIVAMLSTRTVLRNQDYQNAIRMWTSNIRARPDNERAHALLGFALLDKGMVAEAERQLVRAYEMSPRIYWSLMGMGRLRFRQGRYAEASEYLQKARRHANSHAIACEYLARVEEQHGNWSQAAEYYREAVSVDPTYESVRIGLAQACLKSGDTAQGVRVLREVLDIHSKSLDARRQLAETLATTDARNVRNGPEALRLAEELIANIGKASASELDILAAAYAANGRFDDAAATAERALRLPADSAVRQRLRNRLKMYQKGKAVFEPVETIGRT